MKKLLLLMLSAVVIFGLVACGNKVDDDTSDKFIAKAEEAVSLLNDDNYRGIYEMFDETMKEGLPESDMKEMFPPIFEQSGDFKDIQKSSVEEKDERYIVVLAANYSKENHVFTITFNKNEEIAGFFVK